MSATPEKIAERLELSADEYNVNGAAAALIRAQADALKLIAEMDGDQPARSDWDMLRIARAALKAAP